MKLFCAASFAAALSFPVALMTLGLSAPAARASVVYNLDVDKCTGTCGANPFGTVTLTQDGPDVLVSMTLIAGDGLVSTGSGKSLLFDLDVTGAVISDLTPGFAVLGSGGHAAGLGKFAYGVTCAPVDCGPGASKTFTGTLSFDIGVGSGTLTPDDFIPNASGIFFASDIIGSNGKTGPVGANGACTSGCGPLLTPPVPEPVSFALVGTGLIAVFFLRRRTRH